ncbi:exocyst complex component 7-like, partial [Nilaparvata lugens]|uniref:exocyst complex component 7-like n=1 Tax=Nilaparvata lugens TaxID=108931 RepID=UPI00193E7EEC
MTLLDLVATDDELLADDTSSVSSYTQFPDAVSSQLTAIADWLVTQGGGGVGVEGGEYMSVYARVRATVMLKSLQLLKEQQRTGSGGSVQGVGGASSPIMRTKYPQKHEAAGRRASKRLQHVFEKKANKLMMKASQTLEQSTGLTLGNRRGVLHLENREDVVDEHEMENYLVCVMALQRLMQNERHLMAGIIPLSQQSYVFQKIIKDSMDVIVQDGEVSYRSSIFSLIKFDLHNNS